MADNPLFPGSIPRKEGESVNPLFPGYLEGQKAYRPPRGNFLSGYQYYADYWLEQLDQMSIDTGNIPKWFLDRYVDDFKRNMRAIYSVENIPVEQMDDYDQDVMPGVTSVSLSLDPTEWKDPGKVVDSTVKSWIKAGTGLRFKKEGWGLESSPIDLTDYDNNVRTALWKAALGIQQEGEMSELGVSGGRAIAATTRAMAGDGAQGSGVFNFKDADYVVSSGKRGYQEMAKNAVEVERYIKAGPKRDSKHDTFLGALAGALAEELDGKIPELGESGDRLKQGAELDGKKAFVAKTRKDLFGELFEDSTERENFKKAAAALSAKQEMASKMGSSRTAIFADYGLKGFLEARYSGHPEAKKRGDDTVAESGLTRFQDRLLFLKTDLQKHIGINDLGVATGKGGIDSISEELRKIDLKDKGLAVIADDLKKSGDAYKEYLQQVWDALNKFEGKEIKNGVVKNVNKISERELLNIISNIKVNGKELTGGGLFDPSIQRDLLRKIDSDVTLPGKFGKYEKRLQIGAYLSKLETLAATEQDENGNLKIAKLFEENGLPAYKGFFGNQARMVASRLELDRGSYAIEEFYDAVTQGKFMERFVWNRISRKLVGYTPGELLQNRLAKVGYFGLVIDDSQVSKKLKNSEVFNSAFRYKFSIDLDGEKQKFLGDSRLAFIGTYSGFLADLDNGLSAQDIKDILSGKENLFDADGNVIEKFKNKVVGWWTKDPYQGRYIHRQIENYREWLRATKPFGIDIDHLKEGDEEKLFELFKALRKEDGFYGSLNITTQYAGYIQRLGMALNKLQHKLFGNPVFQKFIRPALQLKTIIAEKVSKLTADVLAALATKGLHVLTGGGTVIFDKLIEKVLKPLIRFITRKAVEFSQNFVGALAQGDLSKAMAQVDKEIAQVVKFSMYVIGIPLIMIYILVYGLFGTVLSSISPIDPTRDNGGYGGDYAGGGLPQGENALIKIEKDVIINFLSGAPDFPLNATTSIPNEELTAGIQLTYTIKITPKMDIPDAPIVVTDTVTMLKDGEAPVQGPTQIEVAPSYVAGITTEVTFGPITLAGATYEDSLIKNKISVTTPNFEAIPEEEVSFIRYVRIGTPAIPLDCFVFENISGTEQPFFENALIIISQKTGSFLPKVCGAAGTVTLRRISGEDCGRAYRNNTITFGDTCVSYYTSQPKINYLLAHELGHIYDYRLGIPVEFNTAFSEGSLPTYDYHCGPGNDIWEDFAETIGDWVNINTFGTCAGGGADTSSEDAFWNSYPLHRDFIWGFTN
ncbi:hypothetical protein A2380_02635 [candidate division WWE3 bacterium RIFOXYB1_FULL_43_24]|uniref:Uncharacterized protein n=2 Tax=Katanobacteria TaxID=422282 RepID=A0A0G0YP90_UNCKA|nr:MAG: hypothetical protein UU92_C0007G0082 [candidate division WWE3 bacterium GW2011_GWA1_42_12]KKS34601.1 MAG: hypothetical protein UU97_C0008G0003 [candidate division WWE3 bacterium GW2011_GWD1_42_14]KKS38434.1 MAG: hypothetical protein UV00_C0007G0015 [candidate division WWE3 bacterium GW2011_GWF1_42_14]KKS40478.1 MAG: hypothetical protein UV03_C0006G0010 [candidate division WWE3 bacterium GW2011_GWE1_42_16]KKS66159.1 MAG: hypothetical protein UV35_C0024G0003 [candidate division WWE3 bacte